MSDSGKLPTRPLRSNFFGTVLGGDLQYVPVRIRAPKTQSVSARILHSLLSGLVSG